MSVKKKYEKAIDLYIKELEKKGLYLEYWIADDIGTIAEFTGADNLFLEFQDIKFVVDNDINLKFLIHWYYYNLDNYTSSGRLSINLKSYCNLRKDQEIDNSNFTEYLNNFLKKTNNSK